jgi:zinc D-Ala-D-Ala carboxypeptidase
LDNEYDWRSAATTAAADGITMTITVGWRSAEFQQRLLDDAVGGFARAARSKDPFRKRQAR